MSCLIITIKSPLLYVDSERGKLQDWLGSCNPRLHNLFEWPTGDMSVSGQCHQGGPGADMIVASQDINCL